MKAGSTDYCAELILLTSIYLLDLLHRRQTLHVIRKVVGMRTFCTAAMKQYTKQICVASKRKFTASQLVSTLLRRAQKG